MRRRQALRPSTAGFARRFRTCPILFGPSETCWRKTLSTRERLGLRSILAGHRGPSGSSRDLYLSILRLLCVPRRSALGRSSTIDSTVPDRNRFMFRGSHFEIEHYPLATTIRSGSTAAEHESAPDQIRLRSESSWNKNISVNRVPRTRWAEPSLRQLESFRVRRMGNASLPGNLIRDYKAFVALSEWTQGRGSQCISAEVFKIFGKPPATICDRTLNDPAFR